MNPTIYVVQGGQYGSEGKGQIVDWFCRQHRPDAVIRTGSINAGHTMIYRRHRFRMQQIPCGWASPTTALLIGPGAYIHPPTLIREIEDIQVRAEINIRDRLYIDPRAGVHLDEYTLEAQQVNRHHTIGATGKGCAEAIIHKIRDRGTRNGLLFKDWVKDRVGWEWVQFRETPEMVDTYRSVVIEGTQGTQLDLHLGPYPYTTSRMTTAANWVAEAGLSPGMDIKVLLVVRTYPIRVAGPSGPLPGEIEWPDLWRQWRGAKNAPQVSEESIGIWRDKQMELTKNNYGSSWPPSLINPKYREIISEIPSMALKNMRVTWYKAYKDIEAAIEMTTVTGKPRRIAQIDYDVIAKSALIERPWRTVVTFLNYRFPGLWGRSIEDPFEPFAPEVYRYLSHMGGVTGAPVAIVTTGPDYENVLGLEYLGK